jgi:endonuclease III
VLGNAFGVDEGVVVDTHVRRLSNRLGLSHERDPEKIERDLLELVPEGERTLFSHLLIFHGRRVCKARKPELRPRRRLPLGLHFLERRDVETRRRVV